MALAEKNGLGCDPGALLAAALFACQLSALKFQNATATPR